jgi:uncharacterized damage-inducible protein DinB
MTNIAHIPLVSTENLPLKMEAKEVLLQLSKTLQTLSKDEYIEKIELIGNSSIGEHTRHILELFEQLLSGYSEGIIDYDNRKRNLLLQTDIDSALEGIAVIISELCKDEKNLEITTVYNHQEKRIVTNYSRELMHNIEHCIHHQAIIRIAMTCVGRKMDDDGFGVAKSTQLYRQQCAQ